jgi:hypothetical protein
MTNYDKLPINSIVFTFSTSTCNFFVLQDTSDSKFAHLQNSEFLKIQNAIFDIFKILTYIYRARAPNDCTHSFSGIPECANI